MHLQQFSSSVETSVCTVCVCVSLWCVSICLCDTCECDCFYWCWHSGNIITWQLPMCPCGLIHWPTVRGLAQERRLSIKLEVSRRWPEADSFPICKLSVFIYLLLNDLRFKPRGHFFLLQWEKKNQRRHFSCWSFITGTSKSRSNFEWKVCSTLEMDAFESLPFNTNKCLCHCCPLRHTFPLPLPTHLLLFLPLSPSQLALPPFPALIRVMPTHHSTTGWVRQQDR